MNLSVVPTALRRCYDQSNDNKSLIHEMENYLLSIGGSLQIDEQCAKYLDVKDFKSKNQYLEEYRYIVLWLNKWNDIRHVTHGDKLLDDKMNHIDKVKTSTLKKANGKLYIRTNQGTSGSYVDESGSIIAIDLEKCIKDDAGHLSIILNNRSKDIERNNLINKEKEAEKKNGLIKNQMKDL